MTHPNRNNIIARMRKRGRTIPEIAQTMGRSESYIKDRLREMGLAAVIDSKAPNTDGLWGLPENDRRIAIAKRAARGARAALRSQQIREHSPFSPEFTE